LLSLIVLVLAGCNGNTTSDLGNSSGVVLNPEESEGEAAPTNPVQLASATLTWSAPTEKENGEILLSEELAGFQIFYGPIDNPYENVVSVDSPYSTSFTIDGLNTGVYAFSIVAIDNAGRASLFSNSIVKTIS
jgi:hypothetical protein